MLGMNRKSGGRRGEEVRERTGRMGLLEEQQHTNPPPTGTQKSTKWGKYKRHYERLRGKWKKFRTMAGSSCHTTGGNFLERGEMCPHQGIFAVCHESGEGDWCG